MLRGRVAPKALIFYYGAGGGRVVPFKLHLGLPIGVLSGMGHHGSGPERVLANLWCFVALATGLGGFEKVLLAPDRAGEQQNKNVPHKLEDAGYPAFVTRENRAMPEFDIAVIGAGVFGAWLSRALHIRGQRVLLIDQYGPANNRASSGGETRILRMGYGSREIYTRWSWEALQMATPYRLVQQHAASFIAHTEASTGAELPRCPLSRRAA